MAGDIITMAEHWPLVVTIFEDGFDVPAIERTMGVHEGLLRRGAKFVTVRDARLVTSVPPPTTCKLMAEWQDRLTPLIRANCVGVVNIMSSPVTRAALRAIHWISPPPVPEDVVPSLPEGLAWALERLESEDVHIPADVRSFASSLR